MVDFEVKYINAAQFLATYMDFLLSIAMATSNKSVCIRIYYVLLHVFFTCCHNYSIIQN